jgi:hypothetical protein
MYVRLGQIGGTGIFVHSRVALIFPAALLLTDFSASELLMLIVSYLFVIFLHELGHAFFAMRANKRPYAIVINMMSGFCVVESPQKFKDAVLIYLGGVIFQAMLLIAAISFVWVADEALIAALEPALLILIYFNALVMIASLYPDTERLRTPPGLARSDGKVILDLLRARRAQLDP